MLTLKKYMSDPNRFGMAKSLECKFDFTIG
jgi:hypothetical protein